jgi:polyisoprenoid-binding protein YceI
MAWTIDTSHSTINFSVKHLMVSTARGQFEKFSGTVHFDEVNPVDSTVDVTIEAASINTKDAQRDGHLKSPDFFDVEKYPTIAFKSKTVKHIDATNAKLTGDLTIKDVTKEVTLDVEYQGQQKSPFGTTNAGFTATTKFNREDFNLGWNVALEAGGFLVGKDIKIEIDLELIKAPETAAAAA